MRKNVADQFAHLYAHDVLADTAKTGDAANITASIAKDGGARAAAANSVAEVDATNMPGVYRLELAQAETNADTVAIVALSSTDNVVIDPAMVYPSAITVTANLTLGAIVVSQNVGNRNTSPISLEAIQAQEKVFVITCQDADGDPIDLSALTLRFVVHDTQATPVGVFKVDAGDIVVSGDKNEVASVTCSTTNLATASSELYWYLWDIGNDDPLARGPMTIRPALKDV